jgi:hypothetical protein
MDGNKSIEIVCTACGQETLLKRTPRYEAFKRVGEDLNCAACGHVYASEAEVPFKTKTQSKLFDQSELDTKPEVFKPDETARLCRLCAHYVVNPFIQRCVFLGKEVEATDSCGNFKKPKKPRQPS